jgi:organic hydroperoxide reductase OsmC/OhrA
MSDTPNVRVKSLQFTYKTYLKWDGEKKGTLSSSGKPDIKIATPPEFKGHPGIWSPEELLVASVNICIMTTFLYYAGRKELEFLRYESTAEGLLERIEKDLLFTKVTVVPRILVSLEKDVETVKELIELSEKNCFISNSLKTEVVVRPEIVTKEN